MSLLFQVLIKKLRNISEDLIFKVGFTSNSFIISVEMGWLVDRMTLLGCESCDLL